MKVKILRSQAIAPGKFAYRGDVVELDEKHALRLLRTEDAVLPISAPAEVKKTPEKDKG